MIFLIFFVFDKLLKLFLIDSGNSVFKNEGMFFGISINPLIFLIILIILSILIFRFRKYFFNNISLKIIILGSLMNFSDRLIWGGVIDYLNIFSILSINLADVIICMGVIYLIFSRVISGKKYFFKS